MLLCCLRKLWCPPGSRAAFANERTGESAAVSMRKLECVLRAAARSLLHGHHGSKCTAAHPAIPRLLNLPLMLRVQRKRPAASKTGEHQELKTVMFEKSRRCLLPSRWYAALLRSMRGKLAQGGFGVK